MEGKGKENGINSQIERNRDEEWGNTERQKETLRNIEMLGAIFPGLVFGCDVSSVFRSLRLTAPGPASSSIKTGHINETQSPVPRRFIESLQCGTSLPLRIENPSFTT
jgi:hypothetical protein